LSRAWFEAPTYGIVLCRCGMLCTSMPAVHLSWLLGWQGWSQDLGAVAEYVSAVACPVLGASSPRAAALPVACVPLQCACAVSALIGHGCLSGRITACLLRLVLAPIWGVALQLLAQLVACQAHLFHCRCFLGRVACVVCIDCVSARGSVSGGR
jgi:hypothetical protein